MTFSFERGHERPERATVRVSAVWSLRPSRYDLPGIVVHGRSGTCGRRAHVGPDDDVATREAAMSFFDDVSRKVKQKAEEWDVQGKAEKLATEVDKVAHEAKDKAAGLADDNRDKIRQNLDKAGAKIDERTEGKYADKVARAKETVAGGVDRLAEQRPGGATPPGTPPPSPAAPSATA